MHRAFWPQIASGVEVFNEGENFWAVRVQPGISSISLTAVSIYQPNYTVQAFAPDSVRGVKPLAVVGIGGDHEPNRRLAGKPLAMGEARPLTARPSTGHRNQRRGYRLVRDSG